MPVAWDPTKQLDWWMSEDEKREMQPFLTDKQ